MLCKSCGFNNEGKHVFCENCGEPLVKDGDSESLDDIKEDKRHKSRSNIENVINDKDEQVVEMVVVKSSKNIIKNDEGSYHWMYEFSFWKNPTIFITTFKVLLISLFVPALLMFFLTLGDGINEAFKILALILGYGIIIMTALLIVGYLIIGFIYGGKYYVLFKMDELGINHIQLEKQYKKAQSLELLTAMVNISLGNLSLGGAGIMAASRQNLYTSFKKVRNIKINTKRNTIYLNESLKKNQIYAEKEDFQFVKEYILNNCPKDVKVKGY